MQHTGCLLLNVVVEMATDYGTTEKGDGRGAENLDGLNRHHAAG